MSTGREHKLVLVVVVVVVVFVSVAFVVFVVVGCLITKLHRQHVCCVQIHVSSRVMGHRV